MAQPVNPQLDCAEYHGQGGREHHNRIRNERHRDVFGKYNETEHSDHVSTGNNSIRGSWHDVPDKRLCKG